MKIRTLEHIEISELTETFNHSFENYFVPLKMTEAQLKRKLFVDKVDLQLSAGAFAGDQLIGFILHGVDHIRNKKTAYNSGTGVLPTQRGQQITTKLYSHLIPLLKEKSIKQCLLEVVDENTAAIRSYEKSGFKPTRELICYKGTPNFQIHSPVTGIQTITHPDWEHLSTFRDWEPAWQNSTRTIVQMSNKITTLGYYHEADLRGYISFNPASGGIYQFAVKRNHRRKGIGTALFANVHQKTEMKLSMINLDGGDMVNDAFLQRLGLHPFLKQLEMEMNLDS